MPIERLQFKIQRLLRHEKALAEFGTFAFRETNQQTILNEAARLCAESLNAPYSRICRYQPERNDLLVVSGSGCHEGVVGFAISRADGSSPQGLAFTTGEPQVCSDIREANTFTLPPFYPAHNVVSTANVIVAAKAGLPFGVLEVDSQARDAFDEHDINFLTSFANVLAEAVATSARAEDSRQTIIRMGELVQEKETLSQELKHRVRNSLHLIYGLLTAELAGDHDFPTHAAFRAIALRVVGLAEVFDHLLGVGMTRVINFGEYVAALCNRLPELYGETTIRLNCTTEAVRLDLDDATALGIVITELVNNAYLHAFPEGVGEISTTLRVQSGQLLLTVADDGVGFVEVETKRRGMGLVRRVIQKLNGTLTMQSINGTTWTITVPLRNEPQAACANHQCRRPASVLQ